MDFEWDDEKAATNMKKHGIEFGFATGIFHDLTRYERLEDAMDYGEERWSVTGLVEGMELVVVFTQRELRTRIISARKATPDERKDYWENRLLYL